MKESQISVSCLVAYGLWFATIAMWGASWFYDTRQMESGAIILGLVAGTATVRTYFVAQSQRIKNAIAATSAMQPSVRSMR